MDSDQTVEWIQGAETVGSFLRTGLDSQGILDVRADPGQR